MRACKPGDPADLSSTGHPICNHWKRGIQERGERCIGKGGTWAFYTSGLPPFYDSRYRLANKHLLTCLCFQAESVTGGGQGAAEGYATAVLQGSVCSQVVPAVFQGNCTSHDSHAAQSTVVEVFRQTMPLKGSPGMPLCTKGCCQSC